MEQVPGGTAWSSSEIAQLPERPRGAGATSALLRRGDARVTRLRRRCRAHGCGSSCDCDQSPAQLLEQALFRLDVCVIEFTLLRFLKLERQRLDSPHELHELSSFRAWPRRAVRDAHVCPPTLINGTSVLRGGGGSHPPV